MGSRYREGGVRQEGGTAVKVTEALRYDHQVIERVLETLEKVTDRLEAGKTVSTEVLEDSLDFLNSFVDRLHIAKEENGLFPALRAAGGPEEHRLIDEMVTEHHESRTYLEALSISMEGYRQDDRTATTRLVDSARGYAALQTEHIRKEEQTLFPMVDRLLSDKDQNELIGKFDQVESEQIGIGVHERYDQMVESLSQKVRALTHPGA